MMKKVLVSMLFSGSFVGFVAPAMVQAEDVIGVDQADIQINGTIGLDNTDPEEAIEESHDNWINVTLDTATIFYNVSGRNDIESPTYTIENKSGRPVDVSIADFAQTNAESITEISSLNLVSPAATNTSLIAAGTLTDFATTPVKLFTLANNEGKLTANGTANNAFSTTFNYAGTVSSTTATKSTPTFILTLQLDAVSWTAAP